MSDSTPPPTDALTAATQMVKNGRLDQARETLMQYLMKNPSSEQAWLLMSYVLPDPAKQKDCLERVLKINPNNTVAQSKLAHLLGRRTEELFKKKAEPPAPAPIPPKASPRPEPKPEPFTQSAPEPEPVPSRVDEPVAEEEEPVPSAPPADPSKPVTPAEMVSQPRKNLLSGKWFRIVTIVLMIIMLVVLAVILYIGVIGPAIQSLSTGPVPTVEPVAIPTYPPEWTPTSTPTITPVPPTPTPTPTETPTPTIISSETTIP
jgi:hypothetical protein